MSDMKVFAHYIKDDTTGNEYRWRTLLQIGNSWNIIGSIVYNRKNEMYNFPKRNVHFSRFFAPY